MNGFDFFGNNCCLWILIILLIITIQSEVEFYRNNDNLQITDKYGIVSLRLLDNIANVIVGDKFHIIKNDEMIGEGEFV